jgi:hypothetical protein
MHHDNFASIVTFTTGRTGAAATTSVTAAAAGAACAGAVERPPKYAPASERGTAISCAGAAAAGAIPAGTSSHGGRYATSGRPATAAAASTSPSSSCGHRVGAAAVSSSAAQLRGRLYRRPAMSDRAVAAPACQRSAFDTQEGCRSKFGSTKECINAAEGNQTRPTHCQKYGAKS